MCAVVASIAKASSFGVESTNSKFCNTHFEAIFVFWTIELFMHHHHHHHDLDEDPMEAAVEDAIEDATKKVPESPRTPVKVDLANPLTQKVQPMLMVEVKTGTNDFNSLKSKTNCFFFLEFLDKKTILFIYHSFFEEVKPNGWIAFFGDCLHKAADGLAIGAGMSLFKDLIKN